MKIIVGHSNMDLDCIGSIVLARYLYPDHVAVRSSRVLPATRKLLNLYEDRLGLLPSSELKGRSIERAVIVDTRSADRVAEYFEVAAPGDPELEIWDHHPESDRDIKGARMHARAFGANTTQLGIELMAAGREIAAEDATIALTGIYADTGNFMHSNVAREDLDVASWLLSQGASLRLVKEFLVPLRERDQMILFHEVLGRLEDRKINGHKVQSCYLELEEDSQGLGAVIERVFEVENCDLLFGLFYFTSKKRMLIIGRNSIAEVRLNEILEAFGGGGHAQAASATVKTESGKDLAARLMTYLEESLAPALTAADIMSRDVKTLGPDMPMLEASRFLEEVSHTGAPVVDEAGRLVGMLTLRDIQRARKAEQMHVPLRTFMARSIVTAGVGMAVREIDELFYERNIGHLPVVEGEKLAGIVTRTDILDFNRSDRERRNGLLRALGVEERGGKAEDVLALGCE
jgi:tRNA nucleotidyltransferase (CCA-adding enzyme)